MKRAPQANVLDANAASVWPRRLALLLALLVAAGGTWAIFEFIVWNKLPREIAGKWEVVSGPERGSIIEFHRGGSASARINRNDKLDIAEAQVRVEEDKLHWITRSADGMDLTRTKLIRTLNAHEMVWEERNGQHLRMKRIE